MQGNWGCPSGDQAWDPSRITQRFSIRLQIQTDQKVPGSSTSQLREPGQVSERPRPQFVSCNPAEVTTTQDPGHSCCKDPRQTRHVGLCPCKPARGQARNYPLAVIIIITAAIIAIVTQLGSGRTKRGGKAGSVQTTYPTAKSFSSASFSSPPLPTPAPPTSKEKGRVGRVSRCRGGGAHLYSTSFSFCVCAKSP